MSNKSDYKARILKDADDALYITIRDFDSIEKAFGFYPGCDVNMINLCKATQIADEYEYTINEEFFTRLEDTEYVLIESDSLDEISLEELCEMYEQELTLQIKRAQYNEQCKNSILKTEEGYLAVRYQNAGNSKEEVVFILNSPVISHLAYLHALFLASEELVKFYRLKSRRRIYELSGDNSDQKLREVSMTELMEGFREWAVSCFDFK